MKSCNVCKAQKPLESFNKHRRNKDGLRYSCRACDNEASKVWRIKNPEKHAALNKKSHHRLNKNPEWLARKAEYWRSKRAEAPERYGSYTKRYRRKLKGTPQQRARDIASNLSQRAVKGWNSGKVPYTADQLRQRIEVNFQPGMSWDNHGTWHIDHTKPVRRFVDQGVTDPKIINALANLRPLWAKENLSKAAKF